MGRMEKINQLVKREIGNIIQRNAEDPRLQFVTITNVDVSPDLHQARVNFSVLGDKAQSNAAGEALDSASGYIRRLVGQKVNLRYTPELHFVYDPSIEYSARVEQTLQEIKRDVNFESDKKGQDQS